MSPRTIEFEPTLGTLVLLTAHVAVGILCAWSFVRERQEGREASQPWLWLVLALPVLLLGLQHAVGLGTAFTNELRRQALDGGWYGGRRSVQRLLIELIAPLGAGVLALLLWGVRKQWRRYLPAALAVVFLSGYGALQLISFHDLDAALNQRWLGVHVETWLNGGGIALAWGALCWSFAIGRGRRMYRTHALRRRRIR